MRPLSDPSPDPIRVAAALGLTGGRDARRLEGGSDTMTWRVESSSGPVAVRLFRERQQGAADREVGALQTARAGGVPVPDVLARGVWDRRPATILGWCAGQTVVARLIDAPDRAEGVGHAFGRTQAEIHRLAAPRGWRDEAPVWPPGGDLPPPAADGSGALLHLDFHPLNVLVEGDEVRAVLDWVNAASGDPRADIARTYSIVRADPAVRAFAPRVVHAFRRGWRSGYEARNGPFGDLAGFVSWAGRAMACDLRPRLSSDELRGIRRWTAGWDRCVRRGVGLEAAGKPAPSARCRSREWPPGPSPPPSLRRG